ncbi:MAG: hypothetical protein QM796_06845 [Chthoniobacteraceae bacterium]
MKSKLFLGFLLMSVVVTLLGGCASDNPQQSNTSNVSTIPWNRPEKWEGPGVLGDQLNEGR